MVAPEITCLGSPFQPPGQTLQDGCQNIFNVIGDLLKTMTCEMSTKEKVREIRNAKVEKQTPLWEYHVRSTIFNNLLTVESTQILEDAIKWTVQEIIQQCPFQSMAEWDDFFSCIQNINDVLQTEERQSDKLQRKEMQN